MDPIFPVEADPLVDLPEVVHEPENDDVTVTKDVSPNEIWEMIAVCCVNCQ